MLASFRTAREGDLATNAPHRAHPLKKAIHLERIAVRRGPIGEIAVETLARTANRRI